MTYLYTVTATYPFLTREQMSDVDAQDELADAVAAGDLRVTYTVEVEEVTE